MKMKKEVYDFLFFIIKVLRVLALLVINHLNFKVSASASIPPSLMGPGDCQYKPNP